MTDTAVTSSKVCPCRWIADRRKIRKI